MTAAALGLANSFWVMGVVLLLALVAISRFAQRKL